MKRPTWPRANDPQILRPSDRKSDVLTTTPPRLQEVKGEVFTRTCVHDNESTTQGDDVEGFS